MKELMTHPVFREAKVIKLLGYSQIQKPDIMTVLNREGIELKQKGKYLWGLCPLHPEKTPSFKVDPERQTGHCFGCGFHGDVITLIQKFKGLSFKDALRYLGISNGKSIKPNPRALKKHELVKAFRAWCNDYHNDLCQLIRTLWKTKQKVKDEINLDKLTSYYHLESVWLYQIEVLQGNDDKSRFELFCEVIYGD